MDPYVIQDFFYQVLDGGTTNIEGDVCKGRLVDGEI